MASMFTRQTFTQFDSYFTTDHCKPGHFLSSVMGKGCSWGTGATRFRRERCMSHFATKFEPLLRIKGDRLKFRTGVCGEQNGTNAVKINRRWVLVSPVLIDGTFFEIPLLNTFGVDFLPP